MNNISLNQISNDFDSRFGITLSKESSDILQRLKKIDLNYFSRSDKTLVNKLKVIDPSELTNILKRFFMEMITEDLIADPIKFLDRLSEIIPFTKMQEAVKDDIPDTLKEAVDMFAEAKLYLQMTCEKTPSSISVRISTILDGIISVIETLITAFGVGGFFKPAESDLQADFKSQKIMMLLSLFSMITTMILPILGAAAGGLIIGGIFLAIAALSTVWPFIKPQTTHLPANAENWTKQVKSGGIVAEGRKESLDEIANILKMNRHAILVGPSRVGKSLTAKAFVQAIERGEYPELRGKTVFRINTTDIIGNQASFLGGGNNILNKISDAMGRHRNDIILVFDEIHMACKNNEKMADQLKTFLDEGGEFPHVIGITTTEEYETHVKDNNAFSLRFDRVDIKNTNQDETLKILSDTLLRSRSKPLLNAGVLDKIYKKSCEVENSPQPATSLKLLKRCINRTEKAQQSPTEKKIIEVLNKISSIRSQNTAYGNRNEEAKALQAKLNKQLSELQELLSKEKTELDRLFKSKELLNRVTKETYSTVLKISAISQRKLNVKDERQLKIFLFLHEFLGKSLESYITEKSESLGVKTVIDEELLKAVASE